MAVAVNVRRKGPDFVQSTEPTVEKYNGLSWFDTKFGLYKIWNNNHWLEYGYYWGPGADYGYNYGGYDGGYLSTIDRFSFPFDSGTATHVGNLTGSKGYCSAIAQQQTVQIL